MNLMILFNVLMHRSIRITERWFEMSVKIKTLIQTNLRRVGVKRRKTIVQK